MSRASLMIYEDQVTYQGIFTYYSGSGTGQKPLLRLAFANPQPFEG